MSLPSDSRLRASDFLSTASDRDRSELALCQDLYLRLQTEWLQQLGAEAHPSTASS